MTDPLPDPTAPTIADVAALIRARTKDSNGNEIGTFTPDTRPTDAQCTEAIVHAQQAIHNKVGALSDLCAPQAKLAATYGAAAEIELSYFPEQARTDRSPYTYLIARWEEALTGVYECMVGNLPDSTDDLLATGYGQGTRDAISGTVYAYYTGQLWPALPPIPDEPAPSHAE